MCIGKPAMQGMKGLNRRGKPCAIAMLWGIKAINFVMKFTIAWLNDDYVNATCRMDDGCIKMAVVLFTAFCIAMVRAQGLCTATIQNGMTRYGAPQDERISGMTARPR
ncbi:MAG: hypothetical protein Q7T32_08055 [Moraxellaceae bacterium]|nr:hypothetical protein [Moraxellaceae bacterium]